MTACTALVAGNDPLPELAVEAVEQALARAGQTHPTGVILLLSADFARTAPAAVLAVSRAAGCLQVAGGIVGGLATERGWVFDRPAAAVLVLGGGVGLAAGDTAPGPLFSVADAAALPAEWQNNSPRLGLLFHDPLTEHPFPAWQHARLTSGTGYGVGIHGAELHLAIATGLRLLGAPRCVEAVNGYDLERLGTVRALDALVRELPPEYHGAASLPLHQLSLIVVEADAEPAESLHLIPVLAANADHSLTLGERLRPGQRVIWGIRQPIDAERDLQRRIDRLKAAAPAPEFGLFLSCIGRGPYYYGGEDRDWEIFRERFPGLPFLGAYGTGQVVPGPAGNVVLQNSVALALYSASLPETD